MDFTMTYSDDEHFLRDTLLHSSRSGASSQFQYTVLHKIMGGYTEKRAQKAPDQDKQRENVHFKFINNNCHSPVKYKC